MTTIKRLLKLPTCDLSDALRKCGVPYGGVLDGIKLWSPEHQSGDTRIAGPVYTVKYVLNSSEEKKVDGHYIDTVPKDHIVFISSPPVVNAVYGGLMSTRAKHLGALGTVCDGLIRDLQDHRDLGFPVFAKGTSTIGPAGAVKVTGLNTPVNAQSPRQPDLVINPGDFLVGDLDGVVCIPRNLVEEVMTITEEIIQDNEKVAADVKAGMAFQEASQKHRRHK